MMQTKQQETMYNAVFSEYPDVVTADELGEMLGISRASVYKMLKTNQIRSFRIGSGYKIPKLYVLQYLGVV